MKRSLLIALVAAMVVLAGCGATNPGAFASDSAATSDDTLEPTTGSLEESAGTIAFYVSDEPAAIEDFEHLNVTIEKIGLQKKGADDADDGEEDERDDESPENETDEADEGESDADDADAAEDENATEQNSTDAAGDAPEEDDESESEAADDDANETDELDDKDESEGWVTYEVDNRTVDLTELKGENATRLANLTAPNGTYTAVFVYVSDVEGVLNNGEKVNVKLPSQKLQLHTTFDVGPNASTDFVYDIAVHKAGNSGKYILKPNIAESGTEVPIRDIDRDDDDERDDDDAKDEERDEENDEADEQEERGSEQALNIAVDGNVSAGETVTAVVTDENDSAVAGVNLSVEFEGEELAEANETLAGQTDEDGGLEFTIPDAAAELEIEVVDEDMEGEYEQEFEE